MGERREMRSRSCTYARTPADVRTPLSTYPTLRRGRERRAFGRAATVQVYSTPTILLINTKGSTSSLTGLTDAFSIGQAINEVKHAK